MDGVETVDAYPAMFPSSRLRKSQASKPRRISYPTIPIVEKEESLPSSTPQGHESSIRIKPTLPQTYLRKNHFRPTFRPFCEEIIKFRPFYFTSDWLDRDLVNHRREIANYVRAISALDKEGGNTKISAIMCIEDRICQVSQAINYTHLPPSTARVQWRQAFNNRQPTLFLLYILLNRFGKVVALMRVGPNKAICVFESLACVERAVNHVCETQGKRLLILGWWYPALQNRSERKKIKDDTTQTANWLIQHQDTPVLHLSNPLSDYVLYERPSDSMTMEQNPEGYRLSFMPHHQGKKSTIPRLSSSLTSVTKGLLSPWNEL